MTVLAAPRSTQPLVFGLRTATNDLEQLRGRTPTSAELATHLHVGASHVYRLPSPSPRSTPHPRTWPTA